MFDALRWSTNTTDMALAGVPSRPLLDPDFSRHTLLAKYDFTENGSRPLLGSMIYARSLSARPPQIKEYLC